MRHLSWLHWPWWRSAPRWQAVIVGEESGTVTPLPFVTFRKETDAALWAVRMNLRAPDGLTHFEIRPVARGH